MPLIFQEIVEEIPTEVICRTGYLRFMTTLKRLGPNYKNFTREGAVEEYKLSIQHTFEQLYKIFNNISTYC